MNPTRPPIAPRLALLAALAVLASVASLDSARSAAPAGDPLAAELAHWTALVHADTTSDERSAQIRQMVSPVLAQVDDALRHGRREYALLRLSAARVNVAAQAYVNAHPKEARSLDALDALWKGAGPELAGRAPATATELAAIRPAAVGAMAEAATPQVRVYYDASLEYARATDAGAGLFYLGQGFAQKEFIALCRAIGAAPSPAPAAAAPGFRSIAPEIDALQAEMLAIYRPPVSIDRHGEFIGASAALKEARELEQAGLHRGALLRYLQTELRFQPLRTPPPLFVGEYTRAKLAAFATRLDAPGVDHSIGRLFLEVAQADLDDSSTTAPHATAAAVAEVVLPAYFAALEPARPRAALPAAQVTVTLVRWPYT